MGVGKVLEKRWRTDKAQTVQKVLSSSSSIYQSSRLNKHFENPQPAAAAPEA